MQPRRHATLPGGGLAAWIEKDGPGEVPLVLLHGGGFDHAGLSWGPVTERLAGRVRLLAPDLPGYGESAALGPVQTIPDLARWVLDWMEAAGVGTCDLAGLSMGGGAAMWLALEHPDRIRRLVPVASYGMMARAPFHGLAHRAGHLKSRAFAYRAAARSDRIARLGLRLFGYADAGRISPETVSELREVARIQAGRQSFSAFLKGEIQRTHTTTNLTDRLADIRQPTLLIHGKRDPLVPVINARDAAATIPHCRYLELDAAHWPIREYPDETAAAIADFLELDATGRSFTLP